jgi:SAM-dependent methyltransferase
MDHLDVGRHWNSIAETWASMAKAGYDHYRDALNTPAFLDLLPDVNRLLGLDIGCGDGHNTRLLAKRGATMAAIDISDVFVRYATQAPSDGPQGDFGIASGVNLPFGSSVFDFTTGFMSFMDIPEIELVIREAYRILKPAGFLQFSISHPCFDTPHRKKLRDPEGKTYAIEVGDYFRNLEGEKLQLNKPNSQAAKAGFPPIEIPRFTRTLSQWFAAILESGFVIEALNEPRPSDDVVQEIPRVQDAQVVSYFLHIRARKPATVELSG